MIARFRSTRKKNRFSQVAGELGANAAKEEGLMVDCSRQVECAGCG